MVSPWIQLINCLFFFIILPVADPLVGSIATQYLQNREEHDRLARLWTKRYATWFVCHTLRFLSRCTQKSIQKKNTQTTTATETTEYYKQNYKRNQLLYNKNEWEQQQNQQLSNQDMYLIHKVNLKAKQTTRTYKYNSTINVRPSIEEKQNKNKTRTNENISKPKRWQSK